MGPGIAAALADPVQPEFGACPVEQDSPDIPVRIGIPTCHKATRSNSPRIWSRTRSLQRSRVGGDTPPSEDVAGNVVIGVIRLGDGEVGHRLGDCAASGKVANEDIVAAIEANDRLAVKFSVLPSGLVVSRALTYVVSVAGLVGPRTYNIAVVATGGYSGVFLVGIIASVPVFRG